MKNQSVDGSENKDSSISRRTCMKTIGAGVSLLAVNSGTATATATSHGYGAGGYGDNEYGGPSTTLTVTTDEVSDVGETTATLSGSLTDLAGASSADVYFQYRKAAISTWSSTAVQTLSATGGFSAAITELSDGAEYEFRTVAEGSDGDTAAGDLVAFTTVTAESDPVIESFGVSEAGLPNPHAEISADWAVSDADGDLSAVTVSVSELSGATVRTSATSVSGGNASGSDSFDIKHSDVDIYDVTLRVEDSAGNVVSKTKSVSA